MRFRATTHVDRRAGPAPAPRFAVTRPAFRPVASEAPVPAPGLPAGFNLLRVPVFPPSSAAGVREAAREGLRTPGSGLPFVDRIQRAFGPHDVQGVQAHLGPEASASAGAMQASAFATGDHVVFAGRPSLHTAAHEAAHVVQQRGGVRPAGGIGREGDVHERQANAVADRVVAGRSAADLLNGYAGGRNGSPGTTLPPALSAVQMKRAWESYQDKAQAKWSDWSKIYEQGKTIFTKIYKGIGTEGQIADTANPEPAAEDDTQQRLGKQAAGMYDWIKGLNSTAGGKIYELVVGQYHRKNFGKETLFLGADDRTEPDITVDFGSGFKRAEEAKMVSVEDPRRIDEMVSNARQQLDKERASKDEGYTAWKIRTHINDASNPWPGTTGEPATDAHFLSLLMDKLLKMDWKKQRKDETHNSLQISGINPPADSGIADTLTLEADQFHYSLGKANSKVVYYNIDFKLVLEDSGKETKRFELDWDSKTKNILLNHALTKLSTAFKVKSKDSRLSLSPMKGKRGKVPK